VLTSCVILDLCLRHPRNGCLSAVLAPGIFPHAIPLHLEPSPRHNLSPIIHPTPAIRARYAAIRAILLLCFICRYKCLISHHHCFDSVTNAWGVWRRPRYLFERLVLASRLRLQSACAVPVSETHTTQFRPALALIRNCQSPRYKSAAAGMPVLPALRGISRLLQFELAKKNSEEQASV
jgi:hypothetical protein